MADNKLQQLVAKSLVSLTEDELRTVARESIMRALGEHECREIVRTAIEPILKEEIKNIINDPEMMQKLRERAVQQVGYALQVMQIHFGNTRW